MKFYKVSMIRNRLNNYLGKDKTDKLLKDIKVYKFNLKNIIAFLIAFFKYRRKK